MSGEYVSVESDLRQTIAEDLYDNPTLIAKRGVKLELASDEFAKPVAELYRRAYERGDYFASRYDKPDRQTFDPQCLSQEFQDQEHLRFVFTNDEGELLGTTGFFHDSDCESGPLMTSDETQVDYSGRGLHIMDHFFKRVIPMIEASGAGLATDFVLTPESKGLRRTLQTELGMIAIGIHPHALHHRQLSITKSEITAVKYPEFTPKPAHILSFFEPLYHIVKSQLPQLPGPDIIPSKPLKRSSMLIDHDFEVTKTVSASVPEDQLSALEAGYLPVEFNPDSNQFTVAQYPRKRPDLDFIISNEQVESNQLLVEYLYDVLYAVNRSG